LSNWEVSKTGYCKHTSGTYALAGRATGRPTKIIPTLGPFSTCETRESDLTEPVAELISILESENPAAIVVFGSITSDTDAPLIDVCGTKQGWLVDPSSRSNWLATANTQTELFKREWQDITHSVSEYHLSHVSGLKFSYSSNCFNQSITNCFRSSVATCEIDKLINPDLLNVKSLDISIHALAQVGWKVLCHFRGFNLLRRAITINTTNLFETSESASA